ncbi:MAG: multidrug transporter subunit MdtN [Stappia sp.]|uniref:multidrug transporter subunit MdtN n=1 Tax=Stappia sp. TaxID=1870903 RepID=UPI000C387A8E|nr:multidrug transporter subunit MdtN [Stappia sp.]MAA98133.1 multidrug transporter subunit MdtN [Stappia sp.]MBM18583.1 multidrug transporter subunit MdtN [Stappia sp.]|tara:strand:- start:1123 stop:2175 length:1053 start_codon:yes stop_codon:yes gene_type:complete
MPLAIKSGRLAAISGATISLLIIAATAGLAYRSHLISQANPLSDDASVFADVTRMATSVGGRVKAVHVQENSFVRKGTLLLELEDTAYRLAVEQTRADLEIAEAAVSDRSRNIQAELANADIAAEQVERARSNLDLATQSLERLQPMAEKGYVSAQQLDDARTLKRDAEVSLREALRQQDAAQALVGDDLAAEALVRARRAAVAIAEHELAGTRLYAPHDGHVVGVTTSAGDYTLPAQSLFTLIQSDVWYVNANYTETVIPGIAAGDCASVHVLADRDRVIRGVVESVGWGIGSKDLINLPVSLPIVPKSLEWVRVQQRFPVRIRLFDPPADLMRVGASAVTTVHRDNAC